MCSASKQLRIAYAIQNVGGIDFTQDIGDAIPVKYTLRGLRQAGHDVSCLRLNGRSVIGIDDISEPDNIWNVPLGLSGSKPFWASESGVRRLQRMLGWPYFAFFDTYRFYEACRRCLPRYDLCHEHNGLFSAGGALACLRLGIPYVLTFSADPLFEAKLVGRPLRGIHALVAAWEARLTFKVASKIICVSEPARQHLMETWEVDPGKIVVMPNGVDADLFGSSYDPRPTRTKFDLDGAPVISFVGGFQMWHGLDRLVESFARVLTVVPEAKLMLVGDGPARPVIERTIAELGIDAAVIITGLVPQGRVPEMLAVADVAVIPYPRLPKELWFSPLKLYEYMAAGKAIVASQAGQIAEVIQDRHNGLLVEPGDVNGFAEAIIRLLKDPAERERLGQNARRQAVERHSWDQYIQRLEEIYLSVL
jgi:glycosyltransferase involved in cell wall biosynthesis